MDTWIIYRLTGGTSYKTDYSNASRTQLFNIFDLKWDEEICGLFGIRPENMAEVCDSDAEFGETDFEGALPHPDAALDCGPDPRRTGRFARSVVRTGLRKAGNGESNIRDRFVYYDEYLARYPCSAAGDL